MVWGPRLGPRLMDESTDPSILTALLFVTGSVVSLVRRADGAIVYMVQGKKKPDFRAQEKLKRCENIHRHRLYVTK